MSEDIRTNVEPDVPLHKRLPTWFRLIAICGGPIIYFLFMYHQYLFFSQRAIFTVNKNDTAEFCNRWRTMLSRKYRSSIPERGYAGFCGAIFTDIGVYKLPYDSEYWGYHQGRKHLHNALKPGCTYEVMTIGYGEPFKKGDPLRFPIQKRITRILRTVSCPHDIAGSSSKGANSD